MSADGRREARRMLADGPHDVDHRPDAIKTTRARIATQDAMAVTLTVGELRVLIRDAAADAVAELATRDEPPALLDRSQLAQQLGISATQVTRLAAAGMPRLFVGELPRFRLADVLAWLEERSRERTGTHDA